MSPSWIMDSPIAESEQPPRPTTPGRGWLIQGDHGNEEYCAETVGLSSKAGKTTRRAKPRTSPRSSHRASATCPEHATTSPRNRSRSPLQTSAGETRETRLGLLQLLAAPHQVPGRGRGRAPTPFLQAERIATRLAEE